MYKFTYRNAFLLVWLFLWLADANNSYPVSMIGTVHIRK